MAKKKPTIPPARKIKPEYLETFNALFGPSVPQMLDNLKEHMMEPAAKPLAQNCDEWLTAKLGRFEDEELAAKARIAVRSIRNFREGRVMKDTTRAAIAFGLTELGIPCTLDEVPK